MKLFSSSFAFVISYILLMIPTYVLPYFGSNSSIANSISHSAGLGFLPQWWIHVWFLSTLVLISWIRGKWTDKSSIPAFSIAAGLFDILPLLNFIPLIPTIFHLIAIFIGANNKNIELSESSIQNISKKSTQYGLLISAVCIIGIAIFMLSSNKKVEQNVEPIHKETYTAKQAPNEVSPTKKNKSASSVDNQFSTQGVYPNPFSEGQTWHGSYTCAQGNTPLSIKISEVKEISNEKKYKVSAIFNFGDETHTSGSYYIRGQFDSSTGKAEFQPLSWINQPTGYTAVGFNVSESKANLIKGKIKHSTCTTYEVTLE